jgi:hypothetical protein
MQTYALCESRPEAIYVPKLVEDRDLANLLMLGEPKGPPDYYIVVKCKPTDLTPNLLTSNMWRRQLASMR